MKGWRRAARIALPCLVWLGVWQLLAAEVGQALLLPPPWTVVRRLGQLCLTAGFWRSAGSTLVRVFLGGALGAAAGAAVAAVSAWKTGAEWVFTPLMKVIRATPVASFIILVWLWCRSAWVPLVISALMSAPVVWAAAAQGIRDANPKLLEMGRAYRFSRGKTVRLIYIPSALPAVGTGCRTAMGLAWKAGVAAEALCRPQWALGTQVYNAKLALETADLFAWTAAVVVLSLLVERGIWVLWSLWERRTGRGNS